MDRLIGLALAHRSPGEHQPRLRHTQLTVSVPKLLDSLRRRLPGLPEKAHREHQLAALQQQRSGWGAERLVQLLGAAKVSE